MSADRTTTTSEAAVKIFGAVVAGDEDAAKDQASDLTREERTLMLRDLGRAFSLVVSSAEHAR